MTAADTRLLVPWQLVLGLVVLLLGLVFLADSANMLGAESALAAWPLGIIAVGLIVVLQPDTANRLVGALLIIAGLWLLLNNLGVWSYGFWRTWPYLLILFGAWMVYRARRMREREGVNGQVGYVAGFAFLDRVTRLSADASFNAGEFSAVGGDCRIDLSQARLADGAGEAVIDVFALLGRITLCVPAGWTVDNRVLPLLGRAPTGPISSSSSADAPTVVVQGSAICGSVAVKTLTAGASSVTSPNQ